MTRLHAAIQANSCPVGSQYRPKETISFDSREYHVEFKKRFHALKSKERQSKSRIPIRTMIIVIILVLCVLNVVWNMSLHRSASKVVRTEIAEVHYVSMNRERQSKLRGSTYEGPNGVLLVTNPALEHTTGETPRAKKVMPKIVQPRREIFDLMPAKHPRPPLLKSTEQTIPIYYVNLDRATDRKEYIEAHLEEQHLKAVRVSAIENLENVTVGLVSPLSMLNPNNKELACIASHMVAIHKAVNDRSFFPSSPYAIIIEDDVSFEFPVNWNELLYRAPEDSDVVQLMTSNAEQVVKMAEYYDKTVQQMLRIGEKRNISNPDQIKHDFLWEKRLRGTSLWSTQAYAVRKDNIRGIINKLVTKDPVSGTYSVTLKNTMNQVANCKPSNANSCKLLYPFRLVADVYLYDLLGTAYTLRLPLLNGVSGYNSSIQSEAASAAANTSFTNIASVVSFVRRYSDDLLPTELLLER